MKGNDAGVINTMRKRTSASSPEIRTYWIVTDQALRVDRATSLFNLLAGGGTDGGHRDGERLLYFAITEKFDAVAAAIEKTRLTEGLFIDYCTCFKAAIQIADIHNTRDITEVIVVEAALWKTTVKGHLATFEANAGSAAGTRLLTFIAFASGLAVAGAFAATEALYAVLGTRIRVIGIEIHS